MQHKFKVQMYDFGVEGLAPSGGRSPGERCEPYLRIDFDGFKVFKTDHEKNAENPEWGFKAGFQYVVNNLERLCLRKLKVQCINKVSREIIGEASVDLQTLACGPAHFRLTLLDLTPRRSACGLVKFVCVMKMVSEITVIFRDLLVTMQGCGAPARLKITTSLDEVDGGQIRELNLPHSVEGSWLGPSALACETTLSELLKAPAYETLHFKVIDNFGVNQGEAQLAFRTCFTMKPDTVLPFKVTVNYSRSVEGEDKTESIGAVGEISGNLLYQNLPVYAQMVGGCCVDGEIQGGSCLVDGVPYPQTLAQPPPLWREEPETSALDALITAMDGHSGGKDGDDLQGPNEENDERHWDDIDEATLAEALEQIDLPPPWEKRRERGGERPRTFFADPRTRRTTWKDPRFIPDNWDQRIDGETGKVYFMYHKTKNATTVDPRGCPTDWEMRLSKSGEIYFAYLPAMTTTFTDPRGMPEGAEPALDDLGRIYFKNVHERSTSWPDPREDQQEVILSTWRQAQFSIWWKAQVMEALEGLQRQRAELDAELAAEAEAERNDSFKTATSGEVA